MNELKPVTEPAASSTQMLQILGMDGHLRGQPVMDPQLACEALRLMLQSRALDDVAIKLQRLGRINLYAPVLGQEAAVIGSALALDPKRDWMVPASREQPALLRHGLPLANLLASFMGRLEYAGVPVGVRLLPRQQAIGAQLPQATGLAWSQKLRGERGATLVYCGDGASSEGDFHEALNLAGVLRAPLIVVLINNLYAISTPIRKQTAAASLAARAIGYGFPGRLVDGNDLFAVYAATTEAVQRAVEGGGPTLLECRTYRMGFHNTSDNPSEYRDHTELEAAQREDPVIRLVRYLVSGGFATDAEIRGWDRALRDELSAVHRRVSKLPRPSAGYIFEHVYSELPERIIAQRAETLEEG